MSKVNYQHSVCKDQTVPLLLGSKADKCLDLPLSFASIHLRDWGQPMGYGLGFTRFDFWWGWATMCGGDFGQHNWWIGISLARKESWKSPIKSHAKQSQFYDKRETFFFSQWWRWETAMKGCGAAPPTLSLKTWRRWIFFLDYGCTPVTQVRFTHGRDKCSFIEDVEFVEKCGACGSH